MADPYRDEVNAMAEKLQQVEEELSYIDGAVARRSVLAREATELRKRLQAARARGPLEDLRIASPCNASWENMEGDERVRHCGGCDKDVFNVSGMTRAEATALVKSHSGKELCLRMYRRADGTVITADCPVGAQRKRVRRLVMVGAGVAAGAAGALWAWSDTARMGGVTMGEAETIEVNGAQPHVMGTATAMALPPPSIPSAAPAAPKSATPPVR